MTPSSMLTSSVARTNAVEMFSGGGRSSPKKAKKAAKKGKKQAKRGAAPAAEPSDLFVHSGSSFMYKSENYFLTTESLQ